MNFRMKVDDVFVIGSRTVFSGELKADAAVIKGAMCALEIEGEHVSRFLIEGEVQTGRPCRDLWTTADVSLDLEVIRTREVWLISIPDPD